jgi:hypothetical protein
MRTCEYCRVGFDLPFRRKFCSRKCLQREHNRKNQESLSRDPNRREILDQRLMKRRLKRGIPLDLPIKNLAPKGSGYTAKSGYRFVHVKGHSNANKQGSLAEHVFVMSEHLKRPIGRYESVHHKNGIRDDNRIENLELWSKSQPSGQRLSDKISWALDFLSQYGYECTKEIERKDNGNIDNDLKAVSRYYGN